MEDLCSECGWSHNSIKTNIYSYLVNTVAFADHYTDICPLVFFLLSYKVISRPMVEIFLTLCFDYKPIQKAHKKAQLVVTSAESKIQELQAELATKEQQYVRLCGEVQQIVCHP